MAWHVHVCFGPAVLEIFYELHGFVYFGKRMRFRYFAEGTSRGSGEPAFSRQKKKQNKKTSGSDLHQSCLTFCEESQEDKIIIFLFVPHK